MSENLSELKKETDAFFNCSMGEVEQQKAVNVAKRFVTQLGEEEVVPDFSDLVTPMIDAMKKFYPTKWGKGNVCHF